MTKKMSAGMQMWNIGRMLAGTRHDTEMFDIKAHVDSTLHYGENCKNIMQQLGISTRNRGLEQMEQLQHERSREHARRQDTTRQTGRIQSEHNRLIDMRFQAMRPGKRKSRSGHRYYERRENRSDRGKLL
jgi:hypothetical protein